MAYRSNCTTPKCALSCVSNIGEDVIKRVKRFFDGLRKSLPQRLEFNRMTITKEDKAVKSYTYYLNGIECCKQVLFNSWTHKEHFKGFWGIRLQLNEPNGELTAKSSIKRSKNLCWENSILNTRTTIWVLHQIDVMLALHSKPHSMECVCLSPKRWDS